MRCIDNFLVLVMQVERALRQKIVHRIKLYQKTCVEIQKGVELLIKMKSTVDNLVRTSDQNSLDSPFYVVTVNYNSKSYLLRLVESLAPLRFLKKMIIVDHSETDELHDVRADFPVEVIRQSNKGYGGGLNRGLSEIKDPNATVLLCNPDVALLSPGDVQVALDYMNLDPQIGCLLPSLVNGKMESTHSARRFYTPKTVMAVRVPWLKKNPPKFLREHYYLDNIGHDPFEVDWGCGAAMFIKLSHFPHQLSFDERFFLYFEDVDFCAQAWRNGLSVVLYPDLVLRHDGRKHSHKKLTFFMRHISSFAKYFLKYKSLNGHRSFLSKNLESK